MWYVCVHICVFVYEHACVHTCAYTWKLEVNIGCLLQSFSTLVFEAGSLTVSMELTVLVALAGQWDPGIWPPKPYSQHSVTDMRQSLYGGWGSEFRSSCLRDESFTETWTFPAPENMSENDKYLVFIHKQNLDFKNMKRKMKEKSEWWWAVGRINHCATERTSS